MKKIIQQEIEVCDVIGCEEPASYDPCTICGYAVCYNHEKTSLKTYRHSIHFSGSGDGYYCRACVAKLMMSKDNTLFNAYLALESIINNHKIIYQQMREVEDAAEEAIRKLLPK